MSIAHKGNKNSFYKGGKIRDKDDYILVLKPEHPFCNNKGYVREHRLVVEKIIGRHLLPKERCHHLGAKDDNRPHKLMAFVNQGIHHRFEHNCKIKSSEIIFDGRKLKRSKI